MDLFEHANNRLRNQLPYDGIVHYHGQIMSCEDANFFFERLFAEIDWQRDEAVIFGKKILTQRKVAWYADEPFPYTYSRTVKKAKPWVPVLLHYGTSHNTQVKNTLIHVCLIYITMGARVCHGIVMLKEN